MGNGGVYLYSCAFVLFVDGGLASGRYGKPPYELVLAAEVRRTSGRASHLGYLPLASIRVHSCYSWMAVYNRE